MTPCAEMLVDSSLITLPYQDFAGMNASVELLLELGIPRIQRHLCALQQVVLSWQSGAARGLVSPQGERASGILCIAPSNVGEAFRGAEGSANHLQFAGRCHLAQPACL